MVGVNTGEAIFSGSLEKIFEVILAGAPFAIALLGILGVHEFGHYIAAQWHRVRTSLPLFHTSTRNWYWHPRGFHNDQITDQKQKRHYWTSDWQVPMQV